MNGIKFPQRKKTPKLKPCCGQCGRELAGQALTERAKDFRHELQSGVRLSLSILSNDSDPHRVRLISLDLSDDGIEVGEFGERKFYCLDWDQLMCLFQQWENEGCEIVKVRPMLEVSFGGVKLEGDQP